MKMLFVLSPLLSLAFLTPVHAQNSNAVVVAACGTPPQTYAAGQNRQITQDTTGSTCVISSGGGSGGAVTQGAGNTANPWAVQGVTADGTADTSNGIKVDCVYSSTPVSPTSGTKVPLSCDAASNLRVVMSGVNSAAADAQSNTLIYPRPYTANSGQGALAISGSLFNGTLWDRWRSITGADGTGLGVSAVAISPTSAATGAIIPVVGAGVSNLQGKPSAGNLYTAYMTNNSGAVAYFSVVNSATAPSAGALTAGAASGNYEECITVPSAGVGAISYSPGPPERYNAGIWLIASSAACGTYTAVSTGIVLHATVQ